MKDTLSLQDLFHDRIFRVPDYQRGYAWERQQVGEFLDDLALLDSSRRHYTGTIVLYQPTKAKKVEDNEGTHYEEAHVVDGQQRLTTIVLLLNAISQALTQYPESGSLARGIRRKYIGVTDTDGQPLHKLSLNQDTDTFFKSNVLPETPRGQLGPSVASGQRLLYAKKQISDYLDDADGDHANRESWLRLLHGKVTNRLQFSLYEVEEEAEVGVIFEVMNDRGKQLTDLEKVKNYLLYAASALNVTPENRDMLTKTVNEAWDDILKQLMAAGLGSPANENQLLRAHWLMEYDSQPKNWQGSKSIRSKFDLRTWHHDGLLGALRAYVEGLRNSCVLFCDALRPDRSSTFSLFPDVARNDVTLWSVKVTRIGTTATFLPLLMAVRKNWPTDAEKYLEVLKLCETFAFRVYRVARYYASYRQPAMLHLAYRVAHGQMDFSEVVRDIKSNYGSRQSREAFDEFINPDSPRSRYGWTGLRYFLYEYESHLALGRGGSPKVPWSETDGADSIEHILPQYIEEQPYWRERFDADSHENYVHDIGNLTLTKGNSSLSNKPFPDKKETKDTERYCYETSPLFEELDVAAKWSDWTVAAIDERRAMLLQWAKERWHVDFGNTTGDMYDPDDESGDDGDAP